MKRPRFKNPLDDDLGEPLGFLLFGAYAVTGVLLAAVYIVEVVAKFAPFPFGVPLLLLPLVVFILWKGVDW